MEPPYEEQSLSLLAQAGEIVGRGFAALADYLAFVQILAGIFIIIAVGAGYYLYDRTAVLTGKKKPAGALAEAAKPKVNTVVLESWQRVEERMVRGGEADLKLAIIEADKILDDMLKAANYEGETIAERMKRLTRAQLSNLDDVWMAHKIRNRIVHEPTYTINRRDTAKHLAAYKRAFEEFGILRE